MTGFYFKEVTPFGDFHKIAVDGTTEQELRESFENALACMPMPKLNKMQEWLYGGRVSSFSRETVKDIVENKQGTGKTTAHAMKQIAEAIQNPNKAVRLYSDHKDMPAANARYAREVVVPMIEKLGLKFMNVDYRDITLTFKI